MPVVGGADQVVVAEAVIDRGSGGQSAALRPLHFHRRQRHEQRSGKVAGMADGGLRQGFLDHQFGEAVRIGRRGGSATGMKSTVPAIVVRRPPIGNRVMR